jgi:hypothetical protein
MCKILKGIILLLIAFLFALPTQSSVGQFKITWVHDGNTVKAEGYDKDCLA